jgi:hypothetical protein
MAFPTGGIQQTRGVASSSPGNGKPLPPLPDAAVIAGHQRRYSPQMTPNHKNNGK